MSQNNNEITTTLQDFFNQLRDGLFSLMPENQRGWSNTHLTPKFNSVLEVLNQDDMVKIILSPEKSRIIKMEIKEGNR